MSFSGFPTGFSLGSLLGEFDPNTVAFNPQGDFSVGDFAPMDEGPFSGPYSTAYGPETPQNGFGRFMEGLGSFAEGITPVLTGVDDVARAGMGLPPRIRYSDGSRRQAGEGLGAFIERQRSMLDSARSAFQPSRPVQSEAENMSKDLQIALPNRMAAVFSEGLGSGASNFLRGLQ
jgi:hypothetical protein